MLKKKIWASFQRIIELFTQKFVSKLHKNMGLGDPESGQSYSGSGSRGQKGTGSRIRIRNTDNLYSNDVDPCIVDARIHQ
jgi:hypothetical protein